MNRVRNGRDLRCGAKSASAGWKWGASRNVKGMSRMGMDLVLGGGEVNVQPRDWRRSADPEEEVDAREPCW